MKTIFVKPLFAAILLVLVMALSAEAATVTAVTIANGKLQWNWVPGTTPLVNDDMPTEFRARCGTATGVYTRTSSVPFVASPINTYTAPLAGLLNANGTWFCVVAAANLVGEAVSAEINFFGGTAPASATGLSVVP